MWLGGEFLHIEVSFSKLFLEVQSRLREPIGHASTWGEGSSNRREEIGSIEALILDRDEVIRGVVDVEQKCVVGVFTRTREAVEEITVVDLGALVVEQGTIVFGEKSAVPLHQFRYQFCDFHCGGTTDEFQGAFEGEAHAQAADEDAGMGWARGFSLNKSGTSDFGQELLGIGVVGAHEFVPVVIEVELPVVCMQGEAGAIGNSGLGKLNVGLHVLGVLRQNLRNFTEWSAGI